jgi:hypothetical protein
MMNFSNYLKNSVKPFCIFSRFCVDQAKQQIENFSVDRNSIEAATMTCSK